ncbi:MAG TPA: thiol-disulfide oxidoreductase DCC family protein [Ferruginibacter sp.]|nr:thiol-disulfide oxidoreductase DCC family protein [Ferruginibacter sp.]
MKQQPIILFDGVCNFCNSTVNFIIKRNRRTVIHFAPLQTDTGKKILEQYNLPAESMQSIVFIENGKAYTRSTAALRISRYLGGLWPISYGLIIVPRFIRDSIYSWIARNRYKWFGVRQECMIPTPDVKERFLK